MIIRRLTKREKVIATVCSIFILIYLFYLGIYKPLRAKIAQVQAQISSQEAKFKKDLKLIKESEALDSDYKTYLVNFTQSKPNEQIMSGIVSDIEQAANKLGLKISDIKPQRVQKGEYYNQFSVSLTIDSKFVDIIHFLYIVQNAPYNFNVDEIRFDQTARSRGTMKSNLVLSKVLIPS